MNYLCRETDSINEICLSVRFALCVSLFQVHKTHKETVDEKLASIMVIIAEL